MGGFFGGVVKGFTLKITNRQYGPGAGLNATGNRVVMIGTGAGASTGASDVVLLGPNVLPVDPSSDATGSGTIAIGSNTLAAMTLLNGPWIVLGRNAVASAVTTALAGAGSIVIGDAAAQSSLYLYRNLIIGNSAASTHVGELAGAPDQYNTIIGNDAASSGGAGTGQWNYNTILGDSAAEFFDANTGATNRNVVLGYNAFSPNALAGPGGNVIIGATAGNGFLSGNVNNNVVIGDNAAGGGGAGGESNNVIIGATADGYAASNNVIIGYVAKSAGGSQCLVLGYKANSANSGVSSSLLVEILDDIGATGARALLFGDFLKGNIVHGNSVAGTNRDFPANATNIVKIINGTIGSVNPVGGGYFYVNAGALHWVGTSGLDTLLALG